MNRRDLVLLLAGGVALCPGPGIAQQPKIATVGVLTIDSLAAQHFAGLFPEALREFGYMQGQNIRLEWRSDPGDGRRLPELAVELAALNVDIIVTLLTPAAHAARQATGKIPIVMASAANPVETGLVASLARPGGNVTGIAGVGAERAGKIVEFLQEMLPSLRRIAVLFFASDPFSEPFVEQIRRAGVPAGTSIEPIAMQGADQFEAAFREMEKHRPDALIVQATLANKRASDLALSYRMPSACTRREFVSEGGGLLAYAPPDAETYRRAAVFVDKILKGAKPADLPVEQPTKFELVINLKTAKALGLIVPPALLARADEVIE